MDSPVDPIHDYKIYACVQSLIRATPTVSIMEVVSPLEPSKAPHVHYH